ncbi:hypothetical protein [Nesterenkonia pannonica]|nr:hypothetical protein [Nesterenkonia pannonica]
MHHQLRELGPVVHLSAYNVYAMARYEEVRRPSRTGRSSPAE